MHTYIYNMYEYNTYALKHTYVCRHIRRDGVYKMVDRTNKTVSRITDQDRQI